MGYADGRGEVSTTSSISLSRLFRVGSELSRVLSMRKKARGDTLIMQTLADPSNRKLGRLPTEFPKMSSWIKLDFRWCLEGVRHYVFVSSDNENNRLR